MIAFAVLPVLVLLQALSVEAGEYCQYDDSYLIVSPYKSRYCDNGCCGTQYSDYNNVCCDEVSVGVVVGSVVGGLVGLAILIGVIVCCCCVAACRSCRRPETVYRPMNTNAQTVVVSNTSITQGLQANPGPAMYPLAVAPPPYVQYDNAHHGFGNPAYPPPPGPKY